MSEKVIYTGYFVKNQNELLNQHPPLITDNEATIHAHHVTKEFKPENGIEGIVVGKERILKGIGYVANNEVHALLVKDPDDENLSSNENPHITIATAKGVSPVKSNEAIANAKANGTVVSIEPPIDIAVAEGYFNGQEVVTK